MGKGEYGGVAVLQLVTGAGLLVFWAAFFTVGLAPANPPPGYFAFEHSFPLPDILLALALFIAARLLRSDDNERCGTGRTISLAAGGALLFLGVLDFSFNIQNGMYTTSVTDGIATGFIQLWCIGAGLIMIRSCRITQPQPTA
jgi:hypothetical protein